MKTNGLLLVVVMSCALLAGSVRAQQLAADLPVIAPATETPFQGYGNRDATCVAWTDDCRTCQRAGADLTCSNIGIACQPGKIRCTARQDDKPVQ